MLLLLIIISGKKTMCLLMYLNLSGFSFQPLVCIKFSVSLIKALELPTHENSYALRETVYLSHKSFCHFEKFRRII